jgi:hypothetical protein
MLISLYLFYLIIVICLSLSVIVSYVTEKSMSGVYYCHFRMQFIHSSRKNYRRRKFCVRESPHNIYFLFYCIQKFPLFNIILLNCYLHELHQFLLLCIR